jgi:hypothetical protein
MDEQRDRERNHFNIGEEIFWSSLPSPWAHAYSTHAHMFLNLCIFSYFKGLVILKKQDAALTLLEMLWFLPHVVLILSGWQETMCDAWGVNARLVSLSNQPSTIFLSSPSGGK